MISIWLYRSLADFLRRRLHQKDHINDNAAEQIVGRERRERLSQLAWCGEGCFDSRRRVNSTVMRLTPHVMTKTLCLCGVTILLLACTRQKPTSHFIVLERSSPAIANNGVLIQ